VPTDIVRLRLCVGLLHNAYHNPLFGNHCSFII
jgi:hypothetical protein